jgi:pyruvate dehydrogenase E2 component (dihydrolipoamide acetyltransferase)
MITKVILAKLSPTMEEGTVVKWLKAEGDAVKSGDVLAEIETDKANMEMESLGTGVLRKILVGAGGKAPVGTLIGVIAGPEEDISALLQQAPPPQVTPAPPPPQVAATPPPPSAPPPPRIEALAPSSPRPATPLAVRPPAAAPPPAVSAEAASADRVKASPLARSMAAQQRIPLSLVKGSGPGGRIVKRDIEGFQPEQAAPTPGPRLGTDVPLSSMRRTIARRLTESVQTSPHFYVTVEIDMEPAAAVREQLLAAGNTKISYNDLVLKACAKALVQYTAVNASWGAESIRVHGDVHLGVAVSIPDGLITPVVRNADRKSVLEISAEVKELAARARDRKLKPEEFTGSTFTVSNLGMYDVTEFTAIINPPEGAILAVGSARRVPVVQGDSVRPGLRMRVTLSSDHRLVDGVLAAQFLAEVKRLLENPVSLLV